MQDDNYRVVRHGDDCYPQYKDNDGNWTPYLVDGMEVVYFEENEFAVGETVYFTSIHDNFDRLIDKAHRTPLKVVRVGSSHTSFAYVVESPTGNRFFIDNPSEIER